MPCGSLRSPCPVEGVPCVGPAAPWGPQLGPRGSGAGLTLTWHVLPKVSDATGQMHLTKVADSSPFAVESLIPDDCFVLDNGLCGKIYIWKGTSNGGCRLPSGGPAGRLLPKSLLAPYPGPASGLGFSVLFPPPKPKT